MSALLHEDRPLTRRFGPAGEAARRQELISIQAELRQLRQRNDALAGQARADTLNELIDDVKTALLVRNGQELRENLARMGAIFQRIGELQRIGIV